MYLLKKQGVAGCNSFFICQNQDFCYDENISSENLSLTFLLK